MHISSFVIENESEADDYLDDLLKDPQYRNIGTVQQRAGTLIKDPEIKTYFLNKAIAALKVDAQGRRVPD